MSSSRSAQWHPKLATIDWLDEPIEINDESLVRRIALVRRAVFDGTDDQPLKHLGEAETCVLLKEHRDYQYSWWISDDREALRYARFQQITTRETIDLMRMAVADSEMPDRQAFELMEAMAEQGRTLQLPGSPADLRR